MLPQLMKDCVILTKYIYRQKNRTEVDMKRKQIRKTTTHNKRGLASGGGTEDGAEEAEDKYYAEEENKEN